MTETTCDEALSSLEFETERLFRVVGKMTWMQLGNFDTVTAGGRVRSLARNGLLTRLDGHPTEQHLRHVPVKTVCPPSMASAW